MEKMYAERVNQLQQLLETHPSKKIPELQLLTGSDWLHLVPHRTLDTEEDGRRAMSQARGLASSRFAFGSLHVALIREREPWLTPEGNWARVYGYADGWSEIVQPYDPEDNFQSWEAAHVIPPPDFPKGHPISPRP